MSSFFLISICSCHSEFKQSRKLSTSQGLLENSGKKKDNFTISLVPHVSCLFEYFFLPLKDRLRKKIGDLKLHCSRQRELKQHQKYKAELEGCRTLFLGMLV